MAEDLFDLSGKVAVVTGGSRGLGRAMAEAFAHRGANVVIASRNVDACKKAAEEIRAATGQPAIGTAFHAARWGDSERLAEVVDAEFGRCDVLVNNAGMSPLYPSLTEVSEELFDKVVGVNFKGPFRLCSLIGELMVAGGGGSIINVSSVAAVHPRPSELVYAAAKAALNAMTIGIARAFAPSVRANVIMAGPFLTDVARSWDPDQRNQLVELHIPLGRIGEPNEIVGAALYFASGASAYTTGAVLNVDGGWY